MTRYRSWGGYPAVRQDAVKLWWRSEPLPPVPDSAPNGFLPFGNGRSYGDVCLNPGGAVLDCRGLWRFIAFDPKDGVLQCESGVLLSEILAFAIPRGWFLPVTPGTRFVTLGGAIANDVHGKNHHNAGTFGCHVPRFELLRTDGSRVECSMEENRDWYKATIGGLGLTGVITWAEIQLKPIATQFVDEETIRFRSLGEFRLLAEESDESFEYTVAWIDSLARGASHGRGLFFRANHTERSTRKPPRLGAPTLRMPFSPPIPLVNRLSLRVLNSFYYWKGFTARRQEQVDFGSFFYPLDSVRDWNRIYGARGFLQYQCVIPSPDAEPAIKEILERVADQKEGSFLAVLKRFGGLPSPGLLSFPREGLTLALDFPNRGPRTLALLDRLDRVTMEAGGAVNPSKDARMSPGTFQASFPEWRRFSAFIDPAFSSALWRRVTEGLPRP